MLHVVRESTIDKFCISLTYFTNYRQASFIHPRMPCTCVCCGHRGNSKQIELNQITNERLCETCTRKMWSNSVPLIFSNGRILVGSNRKKIPNCASFSICQVRALENYRVAQEVILEMSWNPIDNDAEEQSIEVGRGSASHQEHSNPTELLLDNVPAAAATTPTNRAIFSPQAVPRQTVSISRPSTAELWSMVKHKLTGDLEDKVRTLEAKNKELEEKIAELQGNNN